ncbi:MAG: hypothetical protein DSZ32_01155 [Gammaproteobacteria bacterium]|nr:MAG: hypothetical protein DSZ32_01155 [Gammaproteobacteria bacterium]
MGNVSDISAAKRRQDPVLNCGAAVSTKTMEEFLRTSQESSKFWEKIVYPAMFAFIVLALYGFFLIYSLTSDMRRVAMSFDPEMGQHMIVMSNSVDALTKDISTMTAQVKQMNANIQNISTKMAALDNLSPMLGELQTMDSSLGDMNTSVTGLDRSVYGLDNSVRDMKWDTGSMRHDMRKMGKPLGFFNKFMP